MRRTKTEWLFGAATFVGMLGVGLAGGIACGGGEPSEGEELTPINGGRGGPHSSGQRLAYITSRLELDTRDPAAPELVLYYTAADPRFEEQVWVPSYPVNLRSFERCASVRLFVPEMTLTRGVEAEVTRLSLVDFVASSPAVDADWFMAEVDAQSPAPIVYVHRTEMGWSAVSLGEVVEAERQWLDAGSPTLCPEPGR